MASATADFTVGVPAKQQKEASTDATLSGLALSGVDFGAFDSATTVYTAPVPNDVTQTTVTPTVNDDGASSYVVKLGDAVDEDGEIPLAVGSNVITIEVTAEDGETTKTYTVTVTRAEANTPATGAPAISGTAQVGETLTASTSGIADADGLSGATFSYQWVSNDGTTDTDIEGAADSTYTLLDADEGKTIKVRVTFTDDSGNEETLTSTATATVIKAPAWTVQLTVPASVPQNTEAAVTMTFGGLEFDSDTSDTDYIFRADVVNADACEGEGIGNDRYMYQVDEDPETRTGTISTSCAPGDYTVQVSISPPGNVELASATADFTVNAPAEQQEPPEPPSADATLSGLTLSDVTLAFTSTTTEYTASIANDVTQTTVTPTVNDDGASYAIKLDGVADADAVIPLAEGGNVITIEVTAEDDQTIKTYTVTVTRAALPSNDATLGSLALSDAPFTFASDTTSYDVNVANGVDETTVTPTTNDDGATYAIKLGGAADDDGTVSLAVGSNVITIEVTAEDGETTKTYTVTVTRAEAPAPEPTVAIELSSDSVEEGTEVTVTMSFANLTPDNDANLVFRADVVGADACEGGGLGADRNISKVDEEPEIRTGTISGDCTAGDYTLEVSLTDDDVELASASAEFSVAEPKRDPTPAPAPTVAIDLSPSASVPQTTEITATMTFGGLTLDNEANLVYRADVVGADACEGDGIGANIDLTGVDEDPEVRTGTIAAACPPGDYTLEVSLFSPENVELASANTGFSVIAPTAAIDLSLSGSVEQNTEIKVTMTFSGLALHSEANLVYRADVVGADACEGDGIGVDVDMTVVDEDPEVRTGTIAAACPAGEYTIEVTLTSADNVELASASAEFSVVEPEPEPAPERSAWLEENPENQPFVGEWQQFTLRATGLEKVDLSVNVISVTGEPSSTGAVGYSTANPPPAAGKVCESAFYSGYAMSVDQTFSLVGCREGTVIHRASRPHRRLRPPEAVHRKGERRTVTRN